MRRKKCTIHMVLQDLFAPRSTLCPPPPHSLPQGAVLTGEHQQPPPCPMAGWGTKWVESTARCWRIGEMGTFIPAGLWGACTPQ